MVPWGDLEALAAVQRQLDVDILVSGHTHQSQILQYDGKYFINPGSATGAYSSITSAPKPSFMLIAVQGDEIVAFTYELVNDEINVERLEISKKIK